MLLVMLLLISLAAPAWPQVVVAPPAPPGVVPAWTVVPTSPRCLYAPNLPGDVFRCKNKYYYYSGGYWYRSKHLAGPWRPVRKLPKPIYRVDRSYFKTAPAW
jgi:hypothetical protein